MIEILAGLLLFITGKTESIAVAPAVATDGNEPIFVAIKGIVNIARSSLETFDKNAVPPSSALILESSIAEKEYQPIPELIATLSPKESGVKKEATAPPKSHLKEIQS